MNISCPTLFLHGMQCIQNITLSTIDLKLNTDKFLIWDFSVTFHIYCSAWPFDMHAHPQPLIHMHAPAHTLSAQTHTHCTRAHMPCWTLKPCDRHVHLFKHCPDRRKTLAISSPLWTCPSLSLWISGAELILPLPLVPAGLDSLGLAPHIAVRSPNWQPAAAADSSLLAPLWADASNLCSGSGWPSGKEKALIGAMMELFIWAS